MSTRLRQFLLRARVPYTARARCWLADDPRLQVGAVVTVEERPGIRWRIAERGELVVTEPQRRTWRVGGVSDR